MGKEPSFQYYPKDWRADAVFGCSIGARGLWHEMMNMMHASERYGYLSSNGLPIPDEQIARYCGVTLQEYQTLLAELERAGVPRRTSNDILFSKRMVEDAKQRSDWRKQKKNQRDTKVSAPCPPDVRTMSAPSPTPSPPAKKEEEKRNTYARAWPPDLFLSQAMREYALAGGVPDPEAEFGAWRDDCAAHDRKYSNWMAAWRTRVRNYAKFSGGKNGAIQQPKSFDAIRREEGDAATKRILERHLGRSGEAGEAPPLLPGRVGKADLH